MGAIVRLVMFYVVSLVVSFIGVFVLAGLAGVRVSDATGRMLEITAFLLAFPLAFLLLKKWPAPRAPRQLTVVERDWEKIIAARFPPQVFRVPVDVFNIPGLESGHPLLEEDRWDRWDEILKLYPVPARTEGEAVAYERAFWSRLAERYTITDNSGGLGLMKSADIIKDYRGNEKWFLREYYAATGRIIEPAIKEYVRLALEENNVKKWKTTGNNLSLSNTEKRNELDRLKRELEEYDRFKVPAHFEKWGNWFSSHIQDMFKNMHKQPDAPPPDIHGDGGFATAEDIVRLGINSNPARPAAHDQVFDD